MIGEVTSTSTNTRSTTWVKDDTKARARVKDTARQDNHTSTTTTRGKVKERAHKVTKESGQRGIKEHVKVRKGSPKEKGSRDNAIGVANGATHSRTAGTTTNTCHSYEHKAKVDTRCRQSTTTTKRLINSRPR